MSKQSHTSGNTIEKPRKQADKVTISLWVVILTFAGMFTSGCGWRTYRLYEGPERPLKEVAILVVYPPLILTMDNKVYPPSPFSLGLNEYHLEPGQHEVSLQYSGWAMTNDTTPTALPAVGKPFTFSEEFEPGYVYRVWPTIVKPLTLKEKDLYMYTYKGLYTCKWQKLTLESYSAEIASDIHCRNLRQQHWIDMLERTLHTFSVHDSIYLESAECPTARSYARYLMDAPGPGKDELLEGKYEQAIQTFSAALQSSEEGDSIHINRGVAYERTGHLQEALEDFSQIPEESSYRGLALLNRAVVKYRMGDMQGARDDLRMAQQSNYANYAPGIGRAIQWVDHILSSPHK